MYVPETVLVCLQHSREPFLDNVGPDVQVFELGIPFALADHQRGLLDQIGLFSLFGLARPVLFLHVLDYAKGRGEVLRRRTDLSRFLWRTKKAANI